MAKKARVLDFLLQESINSGNFIFDNNKAKEICINYGFSNHFDVTKLDNLNKLSPLMKHLDYALIHLGSGKHKFVKGIDNVYHKFEEVKQIIN
ncbi:MAG: hypothetical protein WCJ01_09890 [Ignavibacteria bacterium]